MGIKLHNTLGNRDELFTPLVQGQVKMYSCGPTVHNYLHIGNLRAYIFVDILKRVLEYNEYKVTHIMNITDVGHLTDDADQGEDKMVKALNREGLPKTLESLRKVSQKYTEAFQKDFEKINIIPPDKYTFASDHIKVQIKLIEKIDKKGLIYKTSDGIYFNTSKFSEYGRLGTSASTDHSRIGLNSEKKNSKDFALWKFSGENGIGFESPWGLGFPGWHIECSAMSMKYLGEQFDIHTGGIDHISVHHNNEIAQSEATTGKIPAKYWIHNNHLSIHDTKMAKSGENFITLTTLLELGISPQAYRYWLLTAKYNTRMDYSYEAVKAAETSFENNLIEILKFSEEDKQGEINEEYKKRFTEALNDDLNTPQAVSIAIELAKNPLIPIADKRATLLDFDRVLGLGLSNFKKVIEEIPVEIYNLVKEREVARKSKDFKKSDILRDQVKKAGFEIEDASTGPIIRKI